MELKSGATFDAKIRDVDEKADIALIKIDAPVSMTWVELFIFCPVDLHCLFMCQCLFFICGISKF